MWPASLPILLLSCLPPSLSITLPSPSEFFHTFPGHMQVGHSLERSRVFAMDGIGDIQPLVIDVERKQILVGARNTLLRLSMNNLTLIERFDWRPSAEERQTCQRKGKDITACSNFIRHLTLGRGLRPPNRLSAGGFLDRREVGEEEGDRLLVCGTHGYSPKCLMVDPSSLSSTVDNPTSGIGLSPYSTNERSPSLYSDQSPSTSSPSLVTATALDFNGIDKAILRMLPSATVLRTKRNTRWLNDDVQFVKIVQFGEFFYVFMRETAVEREECGMGKINRIARVCINDIGGDVGRLRGVWTTFEKVTLECEGYDELTDVQWEGETIVGSFVQRSNGLNSSAICVFNSSSVSEAFASDFLEAPVTSFGDRERSKKWKVVNNNRRYFQCETHSALTGGRPGGSRRSILESSQLHIHVDAVVSLPIHSAALEEYRKVVVDLVRVKHHHRMMVAFVATKEGLVKKISLRTTSACTIEVIRLKPGDQLGGVSNLQLDTKSSTLFLSTKSAVHRLTLSDCSRYATKSNCLHALDPYCGWDSHKTRCTTAPHGITTYHWWHQLNVVRRPCRGPENTTSDKEMMGEWVKCGRCVCRHKMCNGRRCLGENSTEVRNCRVDGDWTEWTAWTTCSASCGTAQSSNVTKTRRRFCADPRPAFGGEDCQGVALEILQCATIPPCPLATQQSVHGNWSSWSAWGVCSAKCNSGVKRRTRRCDNEECAGCDEQSKTCNEQQCQQVRRWTEWTPWHASNSSNAALVIKRYKFSCEAHTADPSDLTVGRPREETRVCGEGREDCTNHGFPMGGGDWSEWSPWSHCGNDCGWSNRRRTCTQNFGQCDGVAAERRQCNMPECQAEWNAWSSWSSCSASLCGVGYKTRSRSCRRQEGHADCEGRGEEREECNDECADDFGYRQSWSPWSTCSNEHNAELRSKECIRESLCDGRPIIELRACDGDQSEIMNQFYQSNAIRQPYLKPNLLQIVLSCLTSFLCGVFFTLAAWCCVARGFCKIRRTSSSSTTSFYKSSTPNLYDHCLTQETPKLYCPLDRTAASFTREQRRTPLQNYAANQRRAGYPYSTNQQSLRTSYTPPPTRSTNMSSNASNKSTSSSEGRTNFAQPNPMEDMLHAMDVVVRDSEQTLTRKGRGSRLDNL